jgi:hypothetical protein
MYAFVWEYKLGRGWFEVGSRFEPVQPSWTTAWRGARFKRAKSAIAEPLQKIMAAVWAISSESDARSSSVVFLSLRKNLYISAQGRAKAGTRQLMEEEHHTLYKFGIICKIIRRTWLLIRDYISIINSLSVLCLSPFVRINSAYRFSSTLYL